MIPSLYFRPAQNSFMYIDCILLSNGVQFERKLCEAAAQQAATHTQVSLTP
jgi:hypothetical protein